MRDLIRNYRSVLTGRTTFDSDSESQPLVSSSPSSISSFGSFLGGSTSPGSETDEGIEVSRTLTRANDKENSSSISPLLLKKKYEREVGFGPKLQPPDLEVYSAHTILYDKGRYDPIIIEPIFMSEDNMDVEKAQNPNVLKSPTGCDDNDYREEKKKSTQSSLVTIFAIWNTTMGSSLLAMSWGLSKAGLIPGIVINILVAGLCLYTCYLLLSVYEKHGISGNDTDISHLCLMLVGRWAEILAKVFSIIVLLGANIVYLILMSNFLYSSVYFFHDLLVNTKNDSNFNYSSVICPKEDLFSINATDVQISELHQSRDELFEKAWDLYSTVPIYLAIVMFTVMNFRSPTFFAKFNSLGTISVMYLLIFVAVKAAGWGINMPDWDSEFHLKSTFPALSGMLSLSYFIHNIIVPIMKTNRRQEHNGRDLSIAFGLVAFTYLFIGVIFYITFPLAKSCIEDNIFNNFSKSDTMTIVARLLLMFQLFTVFPLIAFMLRNDVLSNLKAIFRNNTYGEFTYWRVASINGGILVICVVFACFLPKIGTLIRYTGALSGQVYIFMLPNLLKLASLKKEGKLTTLRKVFHYGVIALGTLNLISQLFISD